MQHQNRVQLCSISNRSLPTSCWNTSEDTHFIGQKRISNSLGYALYNIQTTKTRQRSQVFQVITSYNHIKYKLALAVSHTHTHTHTHTHLFDLCQFLVILHEEREVLVGDIHLSVATQPLMLLLCITTTRESILCNLREGEREGGREERREGEREVGGGGAQTKIQLVTSP